VALCLVSTALARNFNSYQVSRVKTPNVVFNFGPGYVSRNKRDVKMHELDDPNSCLFNCTQKMSDGMMAINETDREVVKMTKVCQAFDPMDACYKSCPDSQMRSLLLDFLPLMKQPCLLGSDRTADLKKATDCLNTTTDRVSEKCDPVCNGSLNGDIRLRSRIVLSVDPAMVMYDDDKAENQKMLKTTCSFLACQQQCGDPIIKEVCGQETLNVDRKMTSSIFGSLMKIYQDLKALDGPIEECQALL